MFHFMKKRLHIEYCEIFKNTFFIEHLVWLLLNNFYARENQIDFETKSFCGTTKVLKNSQNLVKGCKIVYLNTQVSSGTSINANLGHSALNLSRVAVHLLGANLNLVKMNLKSVKKMQK